MRMTLAVALFAIACLPGCQQQPEAYHVLPAYQRGLLAQAADDGAAAPTGGDQPDMGPLPATSG